MVKWIVALLLFTVSLSAEPSKAQRKRIVVLRPAADAEVVAKVHVIEWSDGRREVVRSLAEATNRTDEIQSVQWTYDLAKGTYTSKRVPPTQAMLDRVAAHRRKYGARFRTATEDATGLMQHSFLYAVETWEPGAYVGFAGLNRTEMDMAWSECSDGWSMQLDRFAGRCRANPDTFVNTTWYVDSCYEAPPTSRAGAFYGSVTGSYHNDDFYDDTQRTWASQQLNVYVTRGLSAYVSHIPSFNGEGSSLLSSHEEYAPYSSPGSSCYTPPGGGGGGGGTDPGDGGGGGGGGGGGEGGGGDDDATCVLVTDGSTGELLGICCSNTTEGLINCAGALLN
ncbi:MAG TPA: hypothetical protein VF618_12575 [Thermoanaerobaculia bacterium]